MATTNTTTNRPAPAEETTNPPAPAEETMVTISTTNPPAPEDTVESLNLQIAALKPPPGSLCKDQSKQIKKLRHHLQQRKSRLLKKLEEQKQEEDEANKEKRREQNRIRQRRFNENKEKAAAAAIADPIANAVAAMNPNVLNTAVPVSTAAAAPDPNVAVAGPNAIAAMNPNATQAVVPSRPSLSFASPIPATDLTSRFNHVVSGNRVIPGNQVVPGSCPPAFHSLVDGEYVNPAVVDQAFTNTTGMPMAKITSPLRTGDGGSICFTSEQQWRMYEASHKRRLSIIDEGTSVYKDAFDKERASNKDMLESALNVGMTRNKESREEYVSKMEAHNKFKLEEENKFMKSILPAEGVIEGMPMNGNSTIMVPIPPRAVSNTTSSNTTTSDPCTAGQRVSNGANTTLSTLSNPPTAGTNALDTTMPSSTDDQGSTATATATGTNSNADATETGNTTATIPPQASNGTLLCDQKLSPSSGKDRWAEDQVVKSDGVNTTAPQMYQIQNTYTFGYAPGADTGVKPTRWSWNHLPSVLSAVQSDNPGCKLYLFNEVQALGFSSTPVDCRILQILTVPSTIKEVPPFVVLKSLNGEEPFLQLADLGLEWVEVRVPLSEEATMYSLQYTGDKTSFSFEDFGNYHRAILMDFRPSKAFDDDQRIKIEAVPVICTIGETEIDEVYQCDEPVDEAIKDILLQNDLDEEDPDKLDVIKPYLKKVIHKSLDNRRHELQEVETKAESVCAESLVDLEGIKLTKVYPENLMDEYFEEACNVAGGGHLDIQTKKSESRYGPAVEVYPKYDQATVLETRQRISEHHQRKRELERQAKAREQQIYKLHKHRRDSNIVLIQYAWRKALRKARAASKKENDRPARTPSKKSKKFASTPSRQSLRIKERTCNKN